MTPASSDSSSLGRLPRVVRLLDRPRRGQPPPFQARCERDLPIVLPDGTRLLADHYAPVTDVPCPVLLIRTPYGRNFPWNLLFGAGLARHGFHVALVSTRGTHGSGGRWRLFRDDIADALPVVDWLLDRPWCDGSFATIGPSFLGYTQLALAAAAPPEGIPQWRAAVVLAPFASPVAGSWPGGVFALQNAIAVGLARVQALGSFPRLMAAMAGVAARMRHLRTLPLLEAGRAVLGSRTDVFEDSLTHPGPEDPFWEGTDLRAAATRLPRTFVVAGWSNPFLAQSLEVYRRRRDSGLPTSLLVGPWTHTTMVDDGWPAVLDRSVPFLHSAFEGADDDGPCVRIHVGGASVWRDLMDWPPPANTQEWLLGADGSLGTAATSGAPTSFRYDPREPTPSAGGARLGTGAGPVDDRKATTRADVLSFTSAPLTAPFDIIGEPEARLTVRVDGGGADLFVRLCDVAPDGRCRNVTDAITYLDPTTGAFGPEGGRVTLRLDATAHHFESGHRLRLHISGGAFPRFARNPGTGEPVATATRLEPATTHVFHDSAHRSSLVLPAS